MNETEKEKLVDVTGTMAKGTPGWEKRTEELAKPEYWGVAISPARQLWDGLTPEERVRLDAKVHMVTNAVRYMLAGMVKGTVKYERDDWTVERWMAHLMGEGADQMNYQILLFNAWHKQKQEDEDAIKACQDSWRDTCEKLFRPEGDK